ncbi:MAG TPA: hypothetical protein VGP15_13925 [Burkholderiales bacterium]|jgi:hypothetical protein|nr:hypothetical protein [Burkholderiales bacterium]
MTRHDRVREHTASDVNARLDDEMRDRLFRYSAMSEDAIAERLEALDREWDVERYLQVLAPSLALSGVALGALRNRKWLLLSASVLGFFLQHATQGWCPPLAVLRRMGVRTRGEIEEERYALKALRGDFWGLPPDAPQNRLTRVDAALDAVRAWR